MTQPLTTSTAPAPTPLTASVAIALARRWRWLAAAVNGLLMVGFVASMFVTAPAAGLPTLVVVGLWVGLLTLSVKAGRLAATAVPLIAAGDYDGAERRLDASMRAFSVLGGAKLLGLHQLAALRHAQRRWDETALLCRELLDRGGRRPAEGRPRRSATPSRLLLIESLLELGDLDGVDRQLVELSTASLGLHEGLVAMLLRLDYLSRRGRWDAMTANLAADAELAELLPARAAAKAQAFLALACQETGLAEWSAWLRRRAELLCDPDELVRHRPALGKLWTGATTSE